MRGRAVSFPIMLILSFFFIAPGAFTQNPIRVDCWITALMLTAVGVVDDLIVEHGTVDRAWERWQVQKGLT